MTSKLEWRVVAGPNIGAILSLGAGRYSVGSGDEADLILSDRTIRPAQLELKLSQDNGLAWVVLAKPLDGQTRVNGEILPPEGANLAPDQVLSLGLSALAYRAPGSDWGDIELVPLAYAQKLAPTEPEKGSIDGSLEGKESPTNEPLVDIDSQKDLDSQDSQNAINAALPKKRSRAGILGLILVILILGLLLFAPSGQNEAVSEAQNLRALLAKEGFNTIEVTERGRSLEATGNLESDSELNRLVDLVKGRTTKVFLRISVRRDLLEAARQALTSYGFYPALFFDNEGRAVVAAYMLNRETEEEAFENLLRDVPSLAPIRKVVHRDDLEPIMLQELNESGITSLRADFREGLVELMAPLDFTDNSALARTFKRITSRVGVPIVYTLAIGGESPNESSQLRPQGAAWSPMSPMEIFQTSTQDDLNLETKVQADPNDPMSTVDVASVTLAPMRFISTRDGQKLFEGSPLPGGWTITDINSQFLTLSRQDETLVVPLGPQ
ncbi:MAG: type III secretion system inner membrane ring subunit SctD [Deltaproteobacteria bacterium]|jgi:type III secretion protein D|nr:type III secretion system inner membrane ring subunit SctD [Deltaproteobacteria bacterium]